MKIDPLGIDRTGDLAIVEIKTDRMSRDMVAQALEPASRVSKLFQEGVYSLASH